MTGVIDHVQVQLTRYDYLLLLKVMMNNLLYDDEHDCHFLFNYHPSQKRNPSTIIIIAIVPH